MPALSLRVGDFVEVRSEQEVLATLDDQGTLDGMPFMPEMLEYCGKRFRVAKRADKTCDTITLTGLRRLYDTVHLEGLRCSGSAHDGCQAYCFLFWKEAWLKRVKKDDVAPRVLPVHAAEELRSDRMRLNELARGSNPTDPAETLYRCQATELLKCSEPLSGWDIRQYIRDIRSGNVRISDVVKALLLRFFQKSLQVGIGYRAQIWTYNRLQACWHGTPYPFLQGQLDKTPRERLGIHPGELVKVKTYEEILATLDRKNKNHGLGFDAEMVPYCGSVHKVIGRVERIIDERTGKMIKIPSDCLLLEGTECQAKYLNNQLFCPRSIPSYWREIWVKRLDKEPSLSGDRDIH
jgi:hypothetical protein